MRNKERFLSDSIKDQPKISVYEIDFLKQISNVNPLGDIDVAFYLIHSMSDPSSDFQSLEKEAALNFLTFIQKSNAKQIIYLSGMTNEVKLSKHLASRKRVNDILRSGITPVTNA